MNRKELKECTKILEVVERQEWLARTKSKRTIRVNKISVEAYNKLKKLGYTVIIVGGNN